VWWLRWWAAAAGQSCCNGGAGSEWRLMRRCCGAMVDLTFGFEARTERNEEVIGWLVVDLEGLWWQRVVRPCVMKWVIVIGKGLPWWWTGGGEDLDGKWWWLEAAGSDECCEDCEMNCDEECAAMVMGLWLWIEVGMMAVHGVYV
jgi:hypothetical protein